ncbi:MAG: ankyrin repeat domain-containing protein [Trueperaceae bacterium]|nr:MAG: ankyrin repeat domain-containing protein [Trueperaceae bacterium]
MRGIIALLTVLILTLGIVVVLWQIGTIQLPFASAPVEPEPAIPSLFDVVQTNDLAFIKQALQGGADVNARNALGQTPLMIAASTPNSSEVLLTLLKAGAEVNTRTEEGWTALTFASRDTNTPAIPLLLLNAGADPTVPNVEGELPLTYAAENSAIRNSGLYPRLVELSERPFHSGWPSGFVVPVEGATISSRASHLPGSPRSYRNGTHEGFDFYNGTVSVPITYGTPIRAVASGTVVRADTGYVEMSPEQYQDVIRSATQSLSTPPDVLDRLRGRQVWIRHPGGFISRYAHLASVQEGLVEGISIVQGQVIGTTGNSGTLEAAEGTQEDPHPHIEIWRGDTYLGQGLEPAAIYELAAQLFGEASLPPYTEE